MITHWFSLIDIKIIVLDYIVWEHDIASSSDKKCSARILWKVMKDYQAG